MAASGAAFTNPYNNPAAVRLLLAVLIISSCALIPTASGFFVVPSSPHSSSSPSSSSSPPPPPTCSGSLQLIHDGVHTSAFPVPLRRNTTGARSNSSSAIVLSAPWPMNWKFWLEGYPNWVLNLTSDLSDAYVQANLLLESEFTAMYDGSSGCTEPGNYYLPYRFKELSPGEAISLCTFSSRFSSIGMTPCQPFTVYWLVRVTSAPPAGSTAPEVHWAGTEWVRARDPTNPICPDSPTNWGYTKFSAWYCPCDPLPPPPPLNAPPAPPLPPPTCSDDTYLLSRDGLYTDSIVADAWVGWTSMFASPSVLTTDVTWPLHTSSGVKKGQLVWAFNWTLAYAAIPFLAVINETVFNELYVGPSARCVPPTGGLSQAMGALAITNKSTGVGILDFVQGEAMLRPCEPLTLYLLASIQDFDNLASPVFAAADWVQAYDPNSPVCPNSKMSWGYTRFELTHCPCNRPSVPPPASPPPASPPAVSPPLASPPPVPLPSNDVLVDQFPFSASCRAARNVSLSPFRMSSLMGPYNSSSAVATYCFVVSAAGGTASGGAEGSGPCANMKLNKVEFIVNPACASESPKALRAVTVNGEKASAFYDTKTWRGQTYGIMAISKLADLFPVVPAGGLRVCLRLSQTSACGSPAGLCYGGSCVYALFNVDRSCCPTSQVPL